MARMHFKPDADGLSGKFAIYEPQTDPITNEEIEMVSVNPTDIDKFPFMYIHSDLHYLQQVQVIDTTVTLPARGQQSETNWLGQNSFQYFYTGQSEYEIYDGIGINSIVLFEIDNKFQAWFTLEDYVNFRGLTVFILGTKVIVKEDWYKHGLNTFPQEIVPIKIHIYQDTFGNIDNNKKIFEHLNGEITIGKGRFTTEQNHLMEKSGGIFLPKGRTLDSSQGNLRSIETDGTFNASTFSYYGYIGNFTVNNWIEFGT